MPPPSSSPPPPPPPPKLAPTSARAFAETLDLAVRPRLARAGFRRVGVGVFGRRGGRGRPRSALRGSATGTGTPTAGELECAGRRGRRRFIRRRLRRRVRRRRSRSVRRRIRGCRRWGVRRRIRRRRRGCWWGYSSAYPSVWPWACSWGCPSASPWACSWSLRRGPPWAVGGVFVGVPVGAAVGVLVSAVFVGVLVGVRVGVAGRRLAVPCPASRRHRSRPMQSRGITLDGVFLANAETAVLHLHTGKDERNQDVAGCPASTIPPPSSFLSLASRQRRPFCPPL